MRRIYQKTLVAILCYCLILTILPLSVTADPPNPPSVPEGPTEGFIDTFYEFSVTGITDPTDHNYSYLFDWGDDFSTGWIGPIPAGENVTAEHRFTHPGDYAIKVKVKDNETDEESMFSQPLIIHITRLEIGSIQGGIQGIRVDIKNVGEISKYVDWRIELVGGTFPGFHINKEFNGTEYIKTGETNTVTTSQVFALGRFKIQVMATCGGEPTATKTVDGFILFFYVVIKG